MCVPIPIFSMLQSNRMYMICMVQGKFTLFAPFSVFPYFLTLLKEMYLSYNFGTNYYFYYSTEYVEKPATYL